MQCSIRDVVQTVAIRLIVSQRCLPEPTEHESGTRYKARSGPLLPCCNNLQGRAAPDPDTLSP
jgi:hypothetical protein